MSILPTATQYARNAIFAGLLPSEIQKQHPKLWLNDEDEGGKNMFEEDMLVHQMKRLGLKIKHSYFKITNHNYWKKGPRRNSFLGQHRSECDCIQLRGYAKPCPN